MNIIQIHSKLIVLHIIHHSWTANVVKGFLKNNPWRNGENSWEKRRIWSNGHNSVDITDPLKQSVEDGTVGVVLLSDVSQGMSSRQQGNKTRNSALSSRSNIEKKRPAVQLRKVKWVLPIFFINALLGWKCNKHWMQVGFNVYRLQSQATSTVSGPEIHFCAFPNDLQHFHACSAIAFGFVVFAIFQSVSDILPLSDNYVSKI